MSRPLLIPARLVFVLGLLSALTPFAIDTYLPSIPRIAQDLGAGIELAQLSVTVYIGVFAAVQLLLGPLSDVYGRRRVIGGGLALFLFADLACALAPNMGLLLLARALQAVGGGAVAVTVPALVRDLFERDTYARVMGLVMLIMGLAPLIAPSIGGLIVLYLSWRWVFGVLALVGVLSAVLYYRYLPETLPPTRRLPLRPRQVLANYLILLRHRAAFGYLLTGSASFAGLMIFVVASPYIYIEIYRASTAQFGLLFSANIFAAIIFTYLNSRLVQRLGAERLLRAGLGVQTLAAGLMLVLAAGPEVSLWVLAVAIGLYMAMVGVVLGNAMASFMAFFPEMAGTASAFTGAARFGLGAIAGTLVSVLHDGTALPLLIGMAVCGLLGAMGYRLLCCRGVPQGAAANASVL
jgi:DHA1 family bicyclomycin/chloramphenicol resistance-like MFS transporter